MIPESFVQDVLARVDITDVVGKYVQLRKGGANLLGLCPFHNEKSPSFTVSPQKQFYHCFGCGAHGNAIRFLMDHTGSSFPETVKTLAESVGLVVPQETRTPQQQAAQRARQSQSDKLTQILDRAQQFYLAQLRRSGEAQKYLEQRGISPDTANKFGLGWTGRDRQGLKQAFENYDDAGLIESGLVVQSEDLRKYDRFRERIMFPIYNTRGKLIGFGGRIIGQGNPKYLNSPETPIFSKGHELYGLWENRKGIHDEGFVLVVEGYMDVVGLSEQGLHNGVATLGTATTPDHITRLMRTSDRIIFSFDGDGAGKRAAWRALNSCLPALRDDVQIRFLFLPDEHDPDSFVRAYGAEAFREQVNLSLALSAFFLQELSARHSLTEAEGRAACLHEARPLFHVIPKVAVRTQIEKDFARLLQLTYEELRQDLSAYEQQQEHYQHLAQSVSGAPTYGSATSAMGSAQHAGHHAEDQEVFEQGQRNLHPSAQAKSIGRNTDSVGNPFASGAKAAESRGADRGSDRATGGRDNWRATRSNTNTMGRRGAIAVEPKAKRLLRLLINHPELLTQITDWQLEILNRHPHYELVTRFIAIGISRGFVNSGAILRLLDTEPELHRIVLSLVHEDLLQEALPDPMAEWQDAIRSAELDDLKAEQTALVATGLRTEAEKNRYKILTERLALLQGNRR